MSVSEASVLFKRIGAVQQVILNRPKALNSLNLEMVRSLASALPSWNSSDLSSVVLKGAGGRAFCAGGDIKKIFEQRGHEDQQMSFFKEEYVLDNQLAEHSAQTVPHVAVWDGTVMGGGVGISIHASFRLATEKTVFAMPETGIGFFPDVGGSYFLPRLLPKVTMDNATSKDLGPAFGLYLALTGARLAGSDLLHAGIATHFVPSASVEKLENDLSTLSAIGSNGYDKNFESVKEVVGAHMPGHADIPAFSYSVSDLNIILDCFNLERAAAEGVEGIFAAVKKAANNGDGPAVAVNALSALKRVSPTSLKVTVEQILRGSKLSLRDCYKMEEHMATEFMRGSDFYEGVRALLVDKTGKPEWNPSSVEQVTRDQVSKYFQ